MQKRIARQAVMVALALVLSYVERLIPLPVPVPGIKLGLANLVTLTCLYLFGWRDALSVSLLRVALGGLMFGSGFSIVYALLGSLCSLLVMALLKITGKLHPVSISAVGGVAHNVAQLAVAALVVRTPGLMAYLPMLILSGAVTGVLVGVTGAALIGRLKPIL